MTTRKTAFITGASRGIGQQVALELAQDHDLILHASKQENLATTVELLKEHHPSCAVEFRAFDLNNTSAIEQGIESITELDVLVNNAGIVYRGGVDISYSEFTKMVQVNLFALFQITQKLVPVLEKKQGYIFDISSMAGVRPVPSVGGYSSCKYAVTGLGANLSRELSLRGIRLTTICPSVIDTDMTKEFEIDNKEKIQTQDIANAIRFCLGLSPGALVERLEILCRAVL